MVNPVHIFIGSADSERSFSIVKIIRGTDRNRLQPDSVEHILKYYKKENLKESQKTKKNDITEENHEESKKEKKMYSKGVMNLKLWPKKNELKIEGDEKYKKKNKI